MVLISDDNQVAYQVLAAVSVPLRGLWFLSFFDNLDDAKAAREAFPSPCGDYGSYQFAMSVATSTQTQSFRPLAGIMVYNGPVNSDQY